jgi:hypothetical protein
MFDNRTLGSLTTWPAKKKKKRTNILGLFLIASISITE